MFVSETIAFHPRTMRLRVCGMTGTDVVLDMNIQSTIDDLKVAAVEYIFNAPDSLKNSIYHKLVLVRTNKLLSGEKTLQQEGLIDNDEVLLIKKRITANKVDLRSHKQKREELKGPSAEEIKEATAGSEACNTDQQQDDHSASVDFQAELRKILISLVEVAQKILCLNPEAPKIFKEVEEYLKEKAATPVVRQEQVKALVDMGFKEDHATKALLLNRMSSSEAVQWLIEHESDPDIDTPLPQSVMEHVETSNQMTEPSEGNNNPSSSDITSSTDVASMLSSFKALRMKQFRPNARALHNLMEMGFKESDVVNALRATGNREDDACEWLLTRASHDPTPDVEEGLDPNSHLYQAIMNNAVIQLGLSEPRSLIAFLHMLENPSNTQQWLNDAETGPLLIMISRIYHAEKHAPSEQALSAAVSRPTAPVSATLVQSTATSVTPHQASPIQPNIVSAITPLTVRMDAGSTSSSTAASGSSHFNTSDSVQYYSENDNDDVNNKVKSESSGGS